MIESKPTNVELSSSLRCWANRLGANAMLETITGGCLCGEIRYECHGDPINSFICHCTDCQQFTGSVFAAALIFDRESFRILSGSPTKFTVTAESGKKVERDFCSKCGASLFEVLEKRPDYIGVAAGSLDDKSVFKPTRHVWTKSQVPTVKVNDNLPKFEKSGLS